MGDNKTTTDKRDRNRVAKRLPANDPDREVQALMRKTGSSYSQVLALIHRYGHDRAIIEREALRLRST